MKTERIGRVVSNMERMGLKQMLVSAPASVFYLTGAWVEPGERMLALYLSAKGDAKLFANRLFALPGTVDVPLVEFDDTEDSVDLLAGHIAPGKMGIDKTWPSQFTIRLMEKAGDMVPVVGSAAVDLARMEKDEEELNLMRIASRINDEAVGATIDRIASGALESGVGRAYAEEALRRGADGDSFEPLVCFGENCAQPHHATDNTRISQGDSVIIDVGCAYRRYCADMTRTVFFGNASDEQRRVYDIVKAANAAGRAAVKPGVPMREVDRAARKVIEDAGYGKYFIHRTGHGIGLEVHEKPDASAVDMTIAKPGMVFSVEPGIYLPGKFGVRIEDLMAVTEDGGESLNALDREIRVV